MSFGEKNLTKQPKKKKKKVLGNQSGGSECVPRQILFSVILIQLLKEFSTVLHTCGAQSIPTLRWSQCSLSNEQAAI